MKELSDIAPTRILLLAEIVMCQGQVIMTYLHIGIQIHSQGTLVTTLPPLSTRKCRKVYIFTSCDNKRNAFINNYLKGGEKHFPLSTYLTFDTYDPTKVLDKLK